MSPEFAARLSDEDWDDIATGDISVELVRAFERAAIARESEIGHNPAALPEAHKLNAL